MICCVRERPIRRFGSHSHDNSVPSTYPWSWSVTSSGKPTYDRRRRSLPLVGQLLLLLVLLLAVHEDHKVGHPSLVSAFEWNIPCPPHPPNHARLCRHWLAGTTYKVVRCVSIAVFVMPTDPQDAYRSIVAAIFCSGLYLIAHGIAQILMQQALFRLWFRN